MRFFAALLVATALFPFFNNSSLVIGQSNNKPPVKVTIFSSDKVDVVVIDAPAKTPIDPKDIGLIPNRSAVIYAAGVVRTDSIIAICAIDPPLDLTTNPCIE
ncbi:MAG: hypothetical protein HY606_11510 [Planctomycetes bacterium]|nr:hypothetical protein [Planctomycetota bacterium]